MSPSFSRLLVFALVAGAVGAGVYFLGGSGGDGPADPRPGSQAVIEPIVLRPEVQRELPDPTNAMILTPPEDFDPEQMTAGSWKVEAHKAGIYTPEVGDGRLALRMLGKEQAKVLRIEGELDPNSFNGVIVDLHTTGEQDIIVMAMRGGRVAVGSQRFTVQGKREVQHIPFSLPKLHGEEKPLDGIEVRFPRSKELVDVFSVALTKRPFATFLPSSESPELIDCAGPIPELRRGFRVSSEVPLSGSFEVQPDSELVYSYCYPADLRIRRARPTLKIELYEGEELLESVDHPLEGKGIKADWYQARMDLAEYAGRKVKMRAFLENKREDREVLMALGEVRQRVRGEAPSTVLLISSDTHRADHVGSFSEDAPVFTPVLDAFGKRGVFFENGYTATNVTNPSHIALLTGVHPRDTRILNNKTVLIDEALTLAESFKQAGYRTYAAVSARHLNHAESGLGQGFDRMSAPRHPERKAPETLAHVMEWLEDGSGEPVFLFLHFFDVHAPYTPEAEFDRKYYPKDKNPFDPDQELGIDIKEIPPFLAGLTDKDFPYQQYRAEVDYLDTELDDVLGHPRVRDGIAAFTSDHGEAFGEHGIWWDHVALYPTTVHVPLMMVWPGGPSELRIEAPVRQIDIGRTLLDLAGLERTEFPGRSLLWTIETPEQTEPRFGLAAHGFGASVNVGPWLLLLNLREEYSWPLEKPRVAHEVELYHLGRDPKCLDNLVDEEFQRARDLRSRLIEWLDAADPNGLGSAGRIQSAESASALQALGYLTTDEEAADPDKAWYTPDPENPWVKRFEDG